MENGVAARVVPSIQLAGWIAKWILRETHRAASRRHHPLTHIQVRRRFAMGFNKRKIGGGIF
jgi:hypothetical protein